MSSKRMSEQQKQRAIAEYAAGKGIKAIAREIDFCFESVRRFFKKEGVEVRPRGMRSPVKGTPLEAEIVQRFQNGQGVGRIRADTRVSQNVIDRTLREHGIEPLRKSVGRGAAHGAWKGGLSITEYGYVLQHVSPNHVYASMRNKMSYVLQHRLVMAEMLGRPLTSKETVHHKNGDKRDNRPENLEVRYGQHGVGVSLMCMDCGGRNIIPASLSKD